MTDITDQEKRVLREWANENQLRDEETHLAARYILATVDAPAPTLAEELRSWAEDASYDEDRDNLLHAADRAEQIEEERDEARKRATANLRAVDAVRAQRDEARDEVERLNREQDRLCAQVQGLVRRDGDHNSEVRMLTEERDEALAEVERLTADLKVALDKVDRLTAERNRIATGRYVTYAEIDGKPVQKVAESNAETPDPADVKPGEAWLVECRGERRNALKDEDDDEPWNTINAYGLYLSEDNEDITLISRLVPTLRVITNPDELDTLAEGAIVRGGDGHPWENVAGLWRGNGAVGDIGAEQFASLGPVTVLWEPEA